MSRSSISASLSRVAEGVGIALDAVKSNKVRAGLTILGVAIGVMVVIGMASMITGINRAVVQELESFGPRTFFVQRYFQGGIDISDGSDELSPWRRTPWLTIEEAEMIERLPLVKAVTWREDANGPVSYQDRKLGEVRVLGMNPSWITMGGNSIQSGRNFNQSEYAAGSHVAVINDYMAEQLFPTVDPVGEADQGLRPDLRRRRRVHRSGIDLFGQQVAGTHDPALDLHQGRGLLEGMDVDHGGPA
jgi:putative ABC transport system permease protein